MENHPCTLKDAELTDTIIGVFSDVSKELGHGFLESTQAEAMVLALEATALRAIREVPIPVWFRGRKIEYFADLLVEGIVIRELKAGRTLERHTKHSCFTIYARQDIEVGLLLSVGIRPQFRRLRFDNERKKIRENPCESVANLCGWSTK